jgi:hypothetical protein
MGFKSKGWGGLRDANASVENSAKLWKVSEEIRLHRQQPFEAQGFPERL